MKQNTNMSENPESILEKLEQYPGSAYLTQHPTDCKWLLAKAQMIAESPKFPTAGLFVGLGTALKTHYVVGMIWAGYSSPDENGYQVLCLSKTQYTDERLADFVACLIAANKGRTRKNFVKVWT
jgi:hypothetical protein